MRALVIAFFSLLMLLDQAFAWDPARDISRGLSNLGRETGRILGQARTDIGNGMDRIDPRLRQGLRDIDRARLELQSSVFTGPALEQWLIRSRNDALHGAMPVPPHIRQGLMGWFSEDILGRARYKIGDGGALNLANNSIRIGTAEAVTLIDVIVFKGPSEAQDLSIWAHEMHHVQQFAEWGVRNFAIRYMRSWNSVENPAYDLQNRFIQSQGQYASTPSQPPMFQNQPQMSQTQNQVGQACATPMGFCQMSIYGARGAPCYCTGPYGPIEGVIQ